VLDSSQSLFDRPRQTSIRSVQTDLKLRLGIGVGLVNLIPWQASCRWYPRVNLIEGRRQLLSFLQQQTVISLQVCWAHDLSFVGGNLAYDSAFYTQGNPVSATRVRSARHGTSQSWNNVQTFKLPAAQPHPFVSTDR
jgi:hypothetical protein